MVWFWGTWGLSSLARGQPRTPALEGEVLAAGPWGSPGTLVFGFLLLRTVVASSSCVWAPSPFSLSLPVASPWRPSLKARPHPGPLLPHPATLCAPSAAHCDWSRSLIFWCTQAVSPSGARAPVSSRLCRTAVISFMLFCGLLSLHQSFIFFLHSFIVVPCVDTFVISAQRLWC